MTRFIPWMLLGFALVLCGGLACTSKSAVPPALTESGYSFSLHTAPDVIWLAPTTPQLPNTYLGFGELVVQVQDTQGQPVDGVPVEFQVEPSWVQSVALTPQRTTTKGGVARAIIEPSTTGVVYVMARVENAAQEASFLVMTHQYNSTQPPGLRGLPYPPYAPYPPH
jgi:hypothetical protein